MTTERRWMKPMMADAASLKVRMPWERGLRRDAMIARREAGLRAAVQRVELTAQEALTLLQGPLRRAV